MTPTTACNRYGHHYNPTHGHCNRCGAENPNGRPDTETTCHCGGAYNGSDHCPECGCEQYESGDCGHREPDRTQDVVEAARAVVEDAALIDDNYYGMIVSVDAMAALRRAVEAAS